MDKIKIRFLDIDRDMGKPVCQSESCELIELHAPHEKPKKKRKRKKVIRYEFRESV